MIEIHTITDRKGLRNLMENARAKDRDDVYWKAFKRLCELDGIGQIDNLHSDFYSTLRAYEELLSAKHGRNTRASRTRQKLAKYGVIRCLEDWATDAKETQGFKLLIDNGLIELTGEYLVLKHRDHFSPKAIAAAQKRLKNAELKLEVYEAFKQSGISLNG